MSGGQPGHRGDTLRAMTAPDHRERHEASQCAHCRAALSAAMATGMEKRQVLDLPAPRLAATDAVWILLGSTLLNPGLGQHSGRSMPGAYRVARLRSRGEPNPL